MKEGTAFYRCVLCNTVVSPWDINAGGCTNCASKKITPANLTLWEKLVQVVRHPKVWIWPR